MDYLRRIVATPQRALVSIGGTVAVGALLTVINLLVIDGVLPPPVAFVAVPVAVGWSVILHRVARRWREEDAPNTGPAGTPSRA